MTPASLTRNAAIALIEGSRRLRGLSTQMRDGFYAVVRRAHGDFGDLFRLLLVGRDHQLSASGVRYPTLVAISVKHFAAFDA